MKALYNEYLTGANREAAIIIAESDAEIAKLNVLFEAVQAKKEADMLAAEAKVLTESGTYDDLTMLYTEAEAEANEKSGGILRSIWNAIKKFFAKIKNFFTGKSTDDIPDEVELDKETAARIESADEKMSLFNSIATKFSSGDYAGVLADVAKLVIPTAAVGAAGAGVGLVVWKASKVKTWLHNHSKWRVVVEKHINKWESNLESKDDLLSKGLKAILSKAKEFINFLFGNEQTLWDQIEKAKAKIKNKFKKNENTNDGAEGAGAGDGAEGAGAGAEGAGDEQPKPKEIPEIKPINRNVPQYKNINGNKYLTKDEKTAAIEDAKNKLGRKLTKDETNNVLDNAAVKKLNAENEAKRKANLKKINDEQAQAAADREAGYGESTSIEDDDSLDTFFESELIDNDYAELIEAFAEL